MYMGPNKVVNYSNRNVWCSYSGPDDSWKVRLLKAYSSTEWVVDVDYIMAQTSGVLVNGRTGWWKLGQFGSYVITNNPQRSQGLLLATASGAVTGSVRHFDEWAKGQQREWWEKVQGFAGVGKYKIQTDAEIAGFYQMCRNLMNPTAPIEP